MEIDKFVLAEALTALLGVTVKLQSQCSDSDGAIKLDITNLASVALLGFDVLELLLNPVSYLTSLLTGLAFGKSQSSSSSLRKELFVVPDEFFDPKYDFDFTDMSESDSDSECARGGEPYKRPYGWMRFALKVRDKYPDGNDWLGGAGKWRNHSDRGEWPVSYHGTDLKGAEGIIKSHYKAGKGQVFGRGIYSSPDIEVAYIYADKSFRSRKTGKTYKVMMQNRVNPKNREIIEHMDYWLVPIPDGTSPEKEKEIVESSIRPYGLLLKEVEEDE